MITLFRKSNCDFCDIIEETLKEESIAHNVVSIGENEVLKHLPRETVLPAIKDDDKLIFGAKEIKDYLDDLKKFVKLWWKYQVDACYIDDDEETC